MDESTRLTELAAIVRSVGKLASTAVVHAESRFVEDLGIDSLDLVALFLEIQDRYGVVIEDEQIGSIQRVGDLLRLISEAHGSRAA